MKIKLSIKNRWTGNVIFEYEKENNTIKETLLEAIKQGSDLRNSDLRNSDLHNSNLHNSNLSGSDLRNSDLHNSNLHNSNLRGSDLRNSDLRNSDLHNSNLHNSDLRGSNLSNSDLRNSDLRGSDLRGSDLSNSDLSGSDLHNSNLHNSNLRGSDLRGSDLRNSDLRNSDLRNSDLRNSDLRGSDLTPIKNDMFIVLLHSIAEIKYLKQNIIAGKIDGSTYDGECACLSGTLFNGAKITDGKQEEKIIKNILTCRDAGRPIERFFLAIKIGDTPENSQFSKLALEWIEEFESLLS